MKKIIYVFLNFLYGCSMFSGAQEVIDFEYLGFDVTFENPSDTNFVLIDSAQVWSIGTPNKDKLYLPPNYGENAIYTDTSLYYGKNLRSSFQFKLRMGGADFYGLSFHTKYDFEEKKDGGTIETSWDNGSSWQNLMYDPMIQEYLKSDWYFYSEDDTIISLDNQPGFTGTRTNMDRYELYWWFNPSTFEDTLLLRFTFASDSSETNQEGWLLDNFLFGGGTVSIPHSKDDRLILLYPNPVADKFFLTIRNGEIRNAKIFTSSGNLVIHINHRTNKEIEVSHLPAGIYYLQLIDNNNNLIMHKFNKL